MSRGGHQWQTRIGVEKRFWLKVWPRGDCWEWRAQLNDYGYGIFAYLEGNGLMAHRVAYTLAKGPIPSELQLDHLCRHRWCVKPSHLEAVTLKTNINRGICHNRIKTQCSRGHSFDGVATWSSGPYKGRSYRTCSACRAIRAPSWPSTKRRERKP